MAIQSYKKYFDIDAVFEDLKEYSPKADKDRFLKAFAFAERAHKKQVRKDGETPYITHPVEVVKILLKLHADEDTLGSALLHDVPEDTDFEIHDVKEEFGDKIGFLVDGITKLSKVHYRKNMPERQIESLKKLLLHTAEDLRVVVIKLADRLHNMRTLENIDQPEKRLRIAKETLEIYVPIANLLGIREIKTHLEDLCFKHLFPSEYKELSEKLESVKKRRRSVTDKFTRIISELASEAKLDLKVSGREKNLYSIYKKICSLGKAIDNVDDRVGIKIVVDDIPDCYQALGFVHSKFIPKTDRFKDYIASSKANSYQSLHTTVFGPDGVLTEIQIRTKSMDAEAEYGVAANFFNNNSMSGDLKRSSWVKKVLEMEKTDKDSDGFLEDLKLDILQDRIFVFTPKGTGIDLPKGASVIDFAYAIHTEIGHHAYKADINGQIKPITTVLKNRDVVSVNTSRKVSPELSWLSFTKTNLAKNKILAYLKRISREKKIKEGHRILQKEFDIAGLGLCRNVNFKKLGIVLRTEFERDFKNLHDLFIAVGEGDINAASLVKVLRQKVKNSLPTRMSKSRQNPQEGVKVNLKIMANNRFGLLKDITEVLYSSVLDIYSLKGWASKYEKEAYFTVCMLVPDLKTLSRIFDELEQIDEVRSVYRVTPEGLFAFYSASILMIALWIFHPLFLRFLSRSPLKQGNPIIFDLIVYSGPFVVLGLI